MVPKMLSNAHKINMIFNSPLLGNGQGQEDDYYSQSMKHRLFMSGSNNNYSNLTKGGMVPTNLIFLRLWRERCELHRRCTVKNLKKLGLLVKTNKSCGIVLLQDSVGSLYRRFGRFDGNFWISPRVAVTLYFVIITFSPHLIKCFTTQQFEKNGRNYFTGHKKLVPL